MAVLVIPFLVGEDDLLRCYESIDADVDLTIIDNSEGGIQDYRPMRPEPPFVIELPHNIGYPASVNLAIKCYPHEPYWLIANHDVVFAPGDLDRLIAEMERGGARWVGINDWRVFGLTTECVQRVGLFDENYHPCYVEDVDYEYRCDLAGVPRYFIQGGTTHVGSASIREPRYRDANARTYPSNRAYHRAKWGGDVRGGEVFTTPFDAGGSIRDWTLDVSRLRDDWCLPDSRHRPAG